MSNLTPEQVSLIDAIIQVESSGNDDAVGDNGKALGCLQIHKNYWIDSKIPGEHKDCFNRQYALQVFSSYMTRYAKEAWTDPKKFDPEKIARIHNGGPTGYRKEATKKYWKKVKDQLNED